ncbi:MULTISPECIES: hypothetical protein [Arthrobacter]|uniref:Uncharacterized protein n=1 Tax=Arthrobacter terricola TaxID=2547396 RepID=A0A4R5KM10_9MICC|nr:MULTISPECIES: hypothetical protein [Arthrobacter]MBT8161456.1 hypothetical protein [Arthrobacter sp. GN70]TDF95627.1 hypothetical protein E1809_11410 [Arthrobacter terricola]
MNGIPGLDLRNISAELVVYTDEAFVEVYMHHNEKLIAVLSMGADEAKQLSEQLGNLSILAKEFVPSQESDEQP